MSTVQFTQEQQLIMAQFAEAKRRIQPAVLDEGHLNGALIADYIRSNGLVPDANGFYAAINALVESLRWTVPPAKLLADKANTGPAKVENPLQFETERSANLKQAEAAAAKTKADAETFTRISSAINSLYLRRLSETAEQKARLTRYVEQQKARNAIPETIFTQVRNEIERLYRDEQTKLERM